MRAASVDVRPSICGQAAIVALGVVYCCTLGSRGRLTPRVCICDTRACRQPGRLFWPIGASLHAMRMSFPGILLCLSTASVGRMRSIALGQL